MRLFIGFLFLALSAFAADVTGKWKAAMQGPDGEMELTFVLKQDGANVTGSVSSPMGDMAISEGKIDDAGAISFTVATDQFKVTHKGAVAGDEMKLKVDIGDRQMEMVAKRSK
jgi:hypothetical protein